MLLWVQVRLIETWQRSVSPIPPLLASILIGGTVSLGGSDLLQKSMRPGTQSVCLLGSTVQGCSPTCQSAEWTYVVSFLSSPHAWGCSKWKSFFFSWFKSCHSRFLPLKCFNNMKSLNLLLKMMMRFQSSDFEALWIPWTRIRLPQN